MDKIKQLLSSYKTTIVLLLVYAFVLALATFIEKWMNTAAAKILVYYSPLFILLQLLMVVNFVLTLVGHRFIPKRKWSLVVIHSALIVILTGALTTHLFGKEGTIHIREGEKNDKMVMHTSKGVFERKLPFLLELKDFRLIRYPGSVSPSSYESDLLVHVDGEIRETTVFMNNVLDVKGYRFFQASYDDDEKGTILSVNKDVAGRTITYSGYLLLMAGFVLMFVTPNSRLRNLSRQLKELRRTMAVFVVFFLLPWSADAQAYSDNAVYQAVRKNAVPAEHAEKFGQMPLQLRGRVVPMNTFSSEILRKLHKENKIGDLNPDQFLLGLFTMPRMWMQVPFISISNNELAGMFNLSENYFSYVQAFDTEGNYKLLQRLNEAYHKPVSERNRFDKDIIKLDEQINTVFLLLHYKMLAIFPQAGNPEHTWYAPGDELTGFSKDDSLFVSQSFPLYLSEVSRSVQTGDWQPSDSILSSIMTYQRKADTGQHIDSKKIRAEIRYNRQHVFAKSRAGYFIFGGLLLILAFWGLFSDKKWLNISSQVPITGIILVFLYHMYGMAMRWYISGYAPWSNSYETMVYVAWATVLAGFVFGRKSHITLALATLFGGVILFVSGLNWMDPQITPLVPVLKSPWLMFHVAVIVGAYGFFGIGFLLGFSNLIIMTVAKGRQQALNRIGELSIINNMALLAGLALMTVGTFLGAIWANESWGRYWGWDPKETWALITVVVYTVVTHLHLVKKWNNLWLFNLLSVGAFASVLMTFLGVNYFLSGMHSYGQNDQIAQVFVYLYGVLFFVVFLAFASYRGFRKIKEPGSERPESRRETIDASSGDDIVNS